MLTRPGQACSGVHPRGAPEHPYSSGSSDPRFQTRRSSAAPERARRHAEARRPGGRPDIERPFDAVLAAAREGQETAWTALYDEYAPLVLGYLRSRGAPDPEDLTGEVFLKVVRSLDTFSGDEADFRSWLLTVTHNALIDQRRKLGRRPSQATDRDELEAALPAVESEPEALEQLTTEEILGLLDELTEDQREALTLRLVAGLSTREIGEIVGKSRGAVKQLQRRAIERLRSLLVDHPYPIDPDAR